MALTDEQRKTLEELWEQYGNDGPEFTIGNHKLIQKLLFVENATFDEAYAQYSEMFGGGSGGGPAKDITPECLSAVKEALGISLMPRIRTLRA